MHQQHQLLRLGPARRARRRAGSGIDAEEARPGRGRCAGWRRRPMAKGSTTRSRTGTASIGMTTALDRPMARTSWATTARMACQSGAVHGGGHASCQSGSAASRAWIVEVDVLERGRLGDRAVDGDLLGDERGHHPGHDLAVVGHESQAGRIRGDRRDARQGADGLEEAHLGGHAQVDADREARQQGGGELRGRPNARSTPPVEHGDASARRPASARKWVQSRTVRPCSSARVAMRSMTSRVAAGSRPEVGSSRNRTSGSCSRARARATRLR